jgi:dipeptidyl aminopeptidase/acylaminoacyl peptidase
VNADGSGQREVSPEAKVFSASWSPDGKRLAFSAVGGEGVFVVGADGKGLHAILEKGSGAVSWSPDGRWIALGPWIDRRGVSVVRPDGSGLRRIAPLSDLPLEPPVWSPDSRAVAYLEGGSVLEGGAVSLSRAQDVWVARADGRAGRRLTQGWRHGYPLFAAEWHPRRLPTAKLGGAYVRWNVPTDSLAKGNELRTTQPVSHLVADGSRVAAQSQRLGCEKTELWAPSTSALTRFLNDCSRPGLAGDRVAWVRFSQGAGVDHWLVTTATVAVPREVYVTQVWGYSSPLSDPVGDGALLVFSSWGPCRISLDPPCAHEPKQNGALFGLRGGKAFRITSSSGALTPVSVDGERILVDHEDGTLELITATGTSLRSFRLNPALVRGVRLQGRDLVVLTPTAVEVTDAETGAFLRRWPVSAADARLEDVQGGVAVLVAGTDIHLLRLTDGRDAVIRAPGLGPVLAQLEPSGLFYSYRVDDTREPGRVAFVPWDRLESR